MRKENQIKRIKILIMLCLVIVTTFISINVGYTDLSVTDVIRILIGKGSAQENLILYSFRFVRILLAILIGAGLSVSGLVFQTISKNTLASPDLLGVSAGAGVAVMLYSYLYTGSSILGIFALPLVSMVGAFAVAIIIYSLAYRKGAPLSPMRLVLIGISVSAGINSAEILITVRLTPEQYASVNTWMIGAISSNTMRHVVVLAVWIFAIIPILIYQSKKLNLLHLSDGIAIGLGSKLSQERLIFLSLAVALSAACISICGAIGFVGLVCPHLAKRLVGSNHQFSIIGSALVGALLMLVADIIARTVIAPGEILIGIVVAIIGAPYFLYLLLARRK